MKRLSLAATVLAALTVLAFFCFRSSRAPQPSVAGTPKHRSSVPVPTPVVPEPIARPMPAGDGHRYAIEFHNEFVTETSRAAQAAGAPSGLLLGFSGELTIARASAPPEGTWYQYRLTSVRPLADSEGQRGLGAAEQRALEEALSRPFYVELDPQGRARALELPTRVDPLIEGMMRHIVAGTQFVTPPNPDARTWRTQELDNVGLAVVEYRVIGENRYEKRKLEYQRLASDSGLVDARNAEITVKTQSTATIGLHARDRFVTELTVVEDVSTTLGEGELMNHSELGLRYLGPARTNAAADWTAAKTLVHSPLDRVPVARPQDPQLALRKRVGDRSLADFIRALRGLSPDDATARHGLLNGLEALLQLEPESAEATADALRSADASTASTLMSALAGADTRDSQKALAGIATDRSVDLDRRESAMALLGLSDAPTEETQQLLREESRQTDNSEGRTAALALGNLVNALGADQGEALFNELVARLTRASAERERALLIDALGNTGHPRLPTVLAPSLTDASSLIRAHAYWALRLVASPEADKLIARGALTDGSADVRARAVEALRYRPSPEATALLSEVIRRDADPAVRAEALASLSAAGLSEAAPILETVAAQDPDPDIRQRAAQMLGRG